MVEELLPVPKFSKASKHGTGPACPELNKATEAARNEIAAKSEIGDGMWWEMVEELLPPPPTAPDQLLALTTQCHDPLMVWRARQVAALLDLRQDVPRLHAAVERSEHQPRALPNAKERKQARLLYAETAIALLDLHIATQTFDLENAGSILDPLVDPSTARAIATLLRDPDAATLFKYLDDPKNVKHIKFVARYLDTLKPADPARKALATLFGNPKTPADLQTLLIAIGREHVEVVLKNAEALIGVAEVSRRFVGNKTLLLFTDEQGVRQMPALQEFKERLRLLMRLAFNANPGDYPISRQQLLQYCKHGQTAGISALHPAKAQYSGALCLVANEQENHEPAKLRIDAYFRLIHGDDPELFSTLLGERRPHAIIPVGNRFEDKLERDTAAAGLIVELAKHVTQCFVIEADRNKPSDIGDKLCDLLSLYARVAAAEAPGLRLETAIPSDTTPWHGTLVLKPPGLSVTGECQPEIREKLARRLQEIDGETKALMGGVRTVKGDNALELALKKGEIEGECRASLRGKGKTAAYVGFRVIIEPEKEDEAAKGVAFHVAAYYRIQRDEFYRTQHAAVLATSAVEPGPHRAAYSLLLSGLPELTDAVHSNDTRGWILAGFDLGALTTGAALLSAAIGLRQSYSSSLLSRDLDAANATLWTGVGILAGVLVERIAAAIFYSVEAKRSR